jgi:hypothetical protein
MVIARCLSLASRDKMGVGGHGCIQLTIDPDFLGTSSDGIVNNRAERDHEPVLHAASPEMPMSVCPAPWRECNLAR